MAQIPNRNHKQVSLGDARLARDGGAQDGNTHEEHEDVREGVAQDQGARVGAGESGDERGSGDLGLDEFRGVVVGRVGAHDAVWIR